MKKKILYVLFLFISVTSIAQTDGITYQAVIVDTNPSQLPGVDVPANNLPNIPIQVRFSILNDSNTLEYQELQNTVTDPYGMIHLTIGQGNASGGTGAFNEIYWIDEKLLQVDIDLLDGNGFVNFSNQSLTYIPYVKHREIIATATLDVDGETNLNSSLSVNNQSPTLLTGDLTVDGMTNLNSELTVNNEATTRLTGDLYVEGSAYFQDGNFVNLYVTENTEMNIVDISGPTTIDGPTVVNGTTRLNGVTEVNNNFSVINANPSLLTGTLQVDGETDLNAPFRVNNASASVLSGSLRVDGATNLNSNLSVNNASTTNLSGDLIVGGTAFFQDAGFENITVNQDSNLNRLTTTGASNLGGTLTVAGAATLNNSLTVANGSLTTLTGRLQVDDVTNLGSNLFVSGFSVLDDELLVNGIANFSSTLIVNNQSATNLSGNLTVGGESNLNGRVTIDADVNGGQTSTASYPLRVQGSNQGIYIKVDGTRANASNNFISFGDDTRIRGRIEGQTTNELRNSFEYVYFSAVTAFEATFLGLMVIADLAGLDDVDASVFEGVQAAQVIADGIIQTQYWNNNVGVSFESGSADYAEWLEKEHSTERFSYGDIVGVRGGKISKTLSQPDHYMVISQSPLVLGNMPEENKEQEYEKVAFMGQVPVKVMGTVNVGDYIIPSGLQDGVGVAVSSEEITVAQYKKIIGVAWTASTARGISYVNVAIGINANDTAALLEKQQQEIASLQSQIDNIALYLSQKDASFQPTFVTEQTEESSQLKSPQHYVWATAQDVSEEEAKENNRMNNIDSVIQVLETFPDMVDLFMDEVRLRLEQQNVNYQQFDQLNRLVTDREYLINFARNYYTN